ncbi:MAG: hypothetical protein LAO09_12285 [Acidobacteriia bacterium]|nr:hypothetical protein [Terriglobia bacterium]
MALKQPVPSLAEQSWPWPDSLDALAAAPDYHTLLLENECVRVIHTHIPPGALVPVHTHRWPAVAHLLSWSDFIRRDHQGEVLFDSRQAPGPAKLPTTQWLDPLPPHSVENIGKFEISILIVELKDR